MDHICKGLKEFLIRDGFPAGLCSGCCIPENIPFLPPEDSFPDRISDHSIQSRKADDKNSYNRKIDKILDHGYPPRQNIFSLHFNGKIRIMEGNILNCPNS